MGNEHEVHRPGTTSAHRFEQTFGGWALIVGGTLLFGALLLIALLPPAPAAHSELARWVQEHSFQLSMSDELMFFASVCLTPATIILLRTVRLSRPVSSLIGCSSLLLAMTLLGLMVVIAGRLVYPVFGIAMSDDSIALIVSMLYGTLHCLQLFAAVGLIALGFALRDEGVWYLLPVASFGAGGLQILGAFPWLTPAWLNVTATAALLFWTIAVGLWLRTTRP
ncbi:hypothetical protein [Nocardia sp. XZ_19_231]|uniref:hypothetical protein n=1 Tax=Nocardia sp. XZ_19_231 TaxID=2769252 RepID=UPI0018907A7B|nr:hypothetical protein [Nocardia sp. XZ_19_231]